MQNEFKHRPLIKYILQIAHVEPLVWHAAVALGSIQKPQSGPSVGDGSVFGFSQYGKAVKILNESLTSCIHVDSEMVLAAALLFATFEVIHKDFTKGSEHVDGSLNYLCELVQVGAIASGDVSSSFVDVFARLAISASIFGGPRTRLTVHPFAWLSSHLAVGRELSMDRVGHAVLFSLSAMRCLEDQMIPAKTASQSIDKGQLPEMRQRLLHSITAWQISLQRLKLDDKDAPLRHRALLLTIYLKYCEISVSTLPVDDLDTTELRYDDRIPAFKDLLALCEHFLDCGDPEVDEQGRMRYPSFTIQIGIIHILWYISIKCRDPYVRRHAMHLLNHYHRGNGDTGHGVMIAGYADMLIKLEEGLDEPSRAEEVPLQRRICNPYFDVVQDDHVLHCEKGNFRLGEEWNRWQPICVFSV